MKRVLGLLVVAAACLGWSSFAQAEEAGPFRLLPTAQVDADGGSSVEATPVRWGVGWRGFGYYAGPARPYATYGRPYYGYYRPYGAYYGGYPYYSGYRGYYGPRVGISFGWY
jgi:hypothetical protein